MNEIYFIPASSVGGMRARCKGRESDDPYRIGAGLVVEALVSVKILFAETKY
jgi:hypothetical protein